MGWLPPKVKDQGHTVWAHFKCTRCGAQPREFCSGLPRWLPSWLKEWLPGGLHLNDRYHEERVCRALLLLDGDFMNAYRGWETDEEVADPELRQRWEMYRQTYQWSQLHK